VSHTAQRATSLQEVADVSLEETAPAASVQPLWFYVRSLWIGWDDIWSAILRAKPWEFPFRLSRLTIVALCPGVTRRLVRLYDFVVLNKSFYIK
jgi:hypothetical protein